MRHFYSHLEYLGKATTSIKGSEDQSPELRSGLVDHSLRLFPSQVINARMMVDPESFDKTPCGIARNVTVAECRYPSSTHLKYGRYRGVVSK